MKNKIKKVLSILIVILSVLSVSYFVNAEEGLQLNEQKSSSDMTHSFSNEISENIQLVEGELFESASLVVEGELFESAPPVMKDENIDEIKSNTNTAFVEIVKEYCNNKNAGFGEVEFSSNLDTDVIFQVFGKELSGAKASYTFHSGKYQLPAGEYKWSALPSKTFTTYRPSKTFTTYRPSEGSFSIKIKCVNSESANSQTLSSELNKKLEKNATTTSDNNKDDQDNTNDNNNKNNKNGLSTDDLQKSLSIVLPTPAVLRSVLQETYLLFLETQDANLVEWYITRDPGNTQEYLGAAVFNQGSGRWEYSWDTTQVPNGAYILIPHIKSKLDKKYKHTPSYVTVNNEKQKGDKIEKILTSVVIKKIKEELPQIININQQHKEQEEHIKKEIIEIVTPYYQETEKKILEKQGREEKENAEEVKEKTNKAVDENIQEKIQPHNIQLEKEQEKSKKEMERLIEIESNKLLDGVLRNDEAQKNRTKEKILTAVIDSVEQIDKIAEEAGIVIKNSNKKELIQKMREATQIQTNKLEKIMEKKKEVLVLNERATEDIFNDSDKDEVSNYDEVNIYNTDPTNADSDGDGYIDGAEILGGFDPTQSAVEAAIEYEEPTNAGYEDEETFSVQSVVVVETEIDEAGIEKVKKLLIQGIAPANSFVTLYIYSIPIIVTVKTDENGNWSYELDKELEDGSHKIYVALTDNSGKIFAKSKALPFIKKALAISVGDIATTDNVVEDVSIFDKRYLYIAGLIIVALIGWILIFTGSKRAKLEDDIMS